MHYPTLRRLAVSRLMTETFRGYHHALKLRDEKTYAATGASELFDGGGFFARLVTNGAQTVLELSNRWLAPQSEKQTPESVPAFDETTNIRTETVPLS